jgi:hypothetical protein
VTGPSELERSTFSFVMEIKCLFWLHLCGYIYHSIYFSPNVPDTVKTSTFLWCQMAGMTGKIIPGYFDVYAII